jgi:hypothetical protein
MPGSIRNTARQAEWMIFFVLDYVFNGGEAYRAARRNDGSEAHRRRALDRLERQRRARSQRATA